MLGPHEENIFLEGIAMQNLKEFHYLEDSVLRAKKSPSFAHKLTLNFV